MQKKSEDFSMQEVMKLVKTPAGQQLVAMLQQMDGKKLQQAADHAAAGNYGNAQDTIRDFLQREDVQKLMKQLGG